MTIQESDTILQLSVLADQTQAVLGLLCDRYFQATQLDEPGQVLFLNGYDRIENILSLVANQVKMIADGLDVLSSIEPVSGESA